MDAVNYEHLNDIHMMERYAEHLGWTVKLAEIFPDSYSLKTVKEELESGLAHYRSIVLSYGNPDVVCVKSIAEAERDAIKTALTACAGNVTSARKVLGIASATMYRKMRDHNINPADYIEIGEPVDKTVTTYVKHKKNTKKAK